MDFSSENCSTVLNFYSDASLNKELGMGAVFDNSWMFAIWPKGFVEKYRPSIEFLELFAVTAALTAWGDHPKLSNRHVTIFYDNEVVVHMVNKSTSACKQCLKLIPIITLQNLRWNRTVFVKHVRSEQNLLSDALSRLNFDKFWKFALDTMSPFPTLMPSCIWPIEIFWTSEINYSAFLDCR